VFSYRQVPRSGIQHSLLFEWFLACLWAGLDWFHDFGGDALDGNDMAFIVAAYRTHMQEEAVLSWWQHRRRRST
jgi:hypothetical protein